MRAGFRNTRPLFRSTRSRGDVSCHPYLLNRTNLLQAWTTNASSNAFGTSTSAANKRQAEVAVRYAF